MLAEIAEQYQVVRGSHKVDNRKYFVGDIMPIDGIPVRNIEAMLNLGWIIPVREEPCELGELGKSVRRRRS